MIFHTIIPMKKERLDKIIASCGLYSRKEVKQLVREGRISVDGSVKVKPEDKFDPEAAQIQIDARVIHYQQFTYLMLHKPAGYVTATTDYKDLTVMDLLPQKYRTKGLFPVGRLDKDTEGLLLITDDGMLAHNLLAPGKHVDKVYAARINGQLTAEDQEAFARGLILSDGTRCLPAVLELTPDPAEVIVTIREGKYHQVKRMLASRGAPVISLKRLQMGPLYLDSSLSPGEYRELTAQEISSLKDL